MALIGRGELINRLDFIIQPFLDSYPRSLRLEMRRGALTSSVSSKDIDWQTTHRRYEDSEDEAPGGNSDESEEDEDASGSEVEEEVEGKNIHKHRHAHVQDRQYQWPAAQAAFHHQISSKLSNP